MKSDFLKLLIVAIVSVAISFGFRVATAESAKPEETEIMKVQKNEPIEYYFRELGQFELTAYCSCPECCGKWAKNRPIDERGNEIVYGASGEILTEGISIAVDPDVIPYGSIIDINGNKYRADDTGGAIRGSRIDIYFADHEQAKQFGVQYADVFIRVEV
jgi:3D (Asp-Asp-Asp) domain-containing protein